MLFVKALSWVIFFSYFCFLPRLPPCLPNACRWLPGLPALPPIWRLCERPGYDYEHSHGGLGKLDVVQPNPLQLPEHSIYWLGYFYSASSSSLLIRGAPDTTRILCRSSRWIATGNCEWRNCPSSLYVAAGAGFEPATFLTKGVESTNELPRPTNVLLSFKAPLSPIHSLPFSFSKIALTMNMNSSCEQIAEPTKCLFGTLEWILSMNSLLHSACYLRTTCHLSARFLRHYFLFDLSWTESASD